MAEQVNHRIENMINELEQMQRTNLYNTEEIREISRRRKEFEYKIQRQTKHKEDFINYIAYDMALLEDIAIRRKEINLMEKKADIEYTIAKRLNRIFKMFIHRFQNDIEIYFQYIKFCRSVGFDSAISGIIGEMLQVHGDKPKMWQLASKWHFEETKNTEQAKEFLLKGIQRHPDSEILYQDLLNLELLSAMKQNDEVIEKQVKKASIIWRSAVKNISNLKFMFKLCDIVEKFSFAQTLMAEIRTQIWSHRDHEKDVWAYVAGKELKGVHWEEMEEFIRHDLKLPPKLRNFICLYEAALEEFADESLCTRYIHELLKLDERTCRPAQLVSEVKRALVVGHNLNVLSDQLYSLWIEVLKEDGTKTNEQLMEILEAACVNSPKSLILWRKRLLLVRADEKKMMNEIEKANKKLKPEDLIILWNVLMENVKSKAMIKALYEKVRNCDSAVLLSVKPKLLQKMYELNGIKAARNLYEEFLRTPPLQLQVHNIMIELEMNEEVSNVKCLRKCYEAATHNFGTENVNIWLNYLEFEKTKGNPQFCAALYQRAVATLQPILVDKFIETNALGRIKAEKRE